MIAKVQFHSNFYISNEFNSHMELDLCFKLINGLLIRYASFTNEIFGKLLSNYSRYAANLNMKAVIFFYSPCIQPIRVMISLCILLIYELLMNFRSTNNS